MSFVSDFKEIKKLYGFCPCCHELFRLSECTLFERALPPRTPFDDLATARQRLARAGERFETVEGELRDQSRTLGQRAASKRISTIAPFLRSCGVEPQEVKALFHPVDYIAFPGLAAGQCTSIDLIDGPPETLARERFHASLESTLRDGRILWETYRITDAGTVVIEESWRATTSGAT